MSYTYYVYIMSNYIDSVLYVGVTNDIWSRVYEHKYKMNPKSFASRYNVKKLLYYEEFDDIGLAINREKQLKGGSRKKKIALIIADNSFFRDLAGDWYE